MSTLDSQIEHVIEFIKIIGFLGGLGYTLFKVGRATERFEQVAVRQTSEITELKTSIDKLFDSNSRLSLFEERQMAQGKRMDEVNALHARRLDEINARLNVHLDQQARYLMMRAPWVGPMASPMPEDKE